MHSATVVSNKNFLYIRRPPVLFLKILFWIAVVGVIIRMACVCMDHPRKISPTNLGTDIMIFFFNLAEAVFLWFYTFGGWMVR